MGTGLTITLAVLFVFLACFNVWSMLAGPAFMRRNGPLWTQLHRIIGYAFVALFAIFSFLMALRLKGNADELPARLVAHLALVCLLAPLLLVKVLVARYQKAGYGLLTALGIGIFTLAFALVALNVTVESLRAASASKSAWWIPATWIAAVLAICLGLLLARRKPPIAAASAVSPAQSTTLPARTAERWQLTLVRTEVQTHDAKTLRFVLPRGEQIAARPGQFLTFEWNIDGKTVTRSYSICSSPAQGSFIEITPKRVGNGCVSAFLNDRAAPGLTVRARGPYGKFCFDETKHRAIVLIAGGSGITPMMAMLRYIDDLCISAHSTLIYCVRTERDIFFRTELTALRLRLANFLYVPVVSQPSGEWAGRKGRLSREILEKDVVLDSKPTFFLCGPPTLMQHARALLTELGVEPERILQESFGGAVSSQPVPAQEAGAFSLTFARSGVTCRVSSSETLLESSERNGGLIPFGCRQGKCGTCATRLLVGRVHMRPHEALTEVMRSQGYVLPCVSQALGDITLEA